MPRPKLPPKEQTGHITRLVELVIATAWIIDSMANTLDGRPKPVSLILISEPGKGKTEALEQFRGNPCLHFSSDASYRGFLDVLDRVDIDHLDQTPTHVVFTEFQKIFQRRSEVWDQLLGLMAQAMEEGVYEIDVYDSIDMGGKRCGLIGAMTSNSLSKRMTYFREMGLLSRAIVVQWNPDAKYFSRSREVMRKGKRKTRHIKLHPPKKPIKIRISSFLGEQIGRFVLSDLKAPEADFRPEYHIRSMVCAAAYLRGARVAIRQDLEYVSGFADLLKVSMDIMTKKKHRELKK